MYKKFIDFNNQVSTTSILRIADNAYIPVDPANVDYQQYLKWIAEGNTPTPADTPNA